MMLVLFCGKDHDITDGEMSALWTQVGDSCPGTKRVSEMQDQKLFKEKIPTKGKTE